MTRPRVVVSVAITVAAITLLVAHLLGFDLKIDGTTAALLFLAALPWLGYLFETIKLGDLEITYAKLVEAETRAEKAGLLGEASVEYLPANLAAQDPNVALVSLRIELERRMRSLAEKRNLEGGRRGLSSLVTLLGGAGILSSEERGALLDLLALLNQAAHGAKVDLAAAEWAESVGGRLLASLDAKLRSG